MIKRLRWIIVPLLMILSGCQATHLGNEIPASLVAQQAFNDEGQFVVADAPYRAGRSYSSGASTGLFSALVHQESGGRNRVVSHAGAVGRAQLMLPTARLMARKLGMKRVARLPRRKLRRLLMRDPGLSDKLGRAYLNEGIRKYGRRDIALIYYNGGPRAANAAYKSLKKTGRMKIYTSETYCYVKSIAKKSGIATAPMKLVKGRAYRRNKARWIRRTGRSPCRT